MSLVGLIVPAVLGAVTFVSLFCASCIALASVRRGLSKRRWGMQSGSSSPGGRGALSPSGPRCSGVACGAHGCCMPGGVFEGGCGTPVALVTSAVAAVAGAVLLGLSAINIGAASPDAFVYVDAAAGAVSAYVGTTSFWTSYFSRREARGERPSGRVHTLLAVLALAAPLAAALCAASAANAIIKLLCGETTSAVAAAAAVFAAIGSIGSSGGAASAYVLRFHPAFAGDGDDGDGDADDAYVSLIGAVPTPSPSAPTASPRWETAAPPADFVAANTNAASPHSQPTALSPESFYSLSAPLAAIRAAAAKMTATSTVETPLPVQVAVHTPHNAPLPLSPAASENLASPSWPDRSPNGVISPFAPMAPAPTPFTHTSIPFLPASRHGLSPAEDGEIA